jgi:hypothetical protein
MIDFMNDRGVDNCFVLFSCAIFGAVTNEEDWDEIKDYARRARWPIKCCKEGGSILMTRESKPRAHIM